MSNVVNVFSGEGRAVSCVKLFYTCSRSTIYFQPSIHVEMVLCVKYILWIEIPEITQKSLSI